MGGMKSEKMEFDKYGKPISKDKKDKDKDRGGMFGDIDFEAMTQGSDTSIHRYYFGFCTEGNIGWV